MYEEVKGILKKYSQEKDFLITKVTACVLGTLILVDEYEDERYKKSVMERLYTSKGEMIKRLIKSQQITGLNFFLDQEVMNVIGKMDNEDYKKLISFYDGEEKYGLNLFNKIIAFSKLNKVNPSLGYTVDIERLRDAYREAKQNPADEITFKWLRMNMWVSSTTSWIPDAIFMKGNEPIDMRLLEGRDCYAGLDLSSTGDITALVLIFPPRNSDEKYILVPFFWVPE